MLPIYKISDMLSIPEEKLVYYGKYTAKLPLDLLGEPKGQLILVTAINPTKYGEGKTVTSIGLAQALHRCGKRAVVTLREPSLGPVFGVKGGACGGGRSQVLPSELINLHFNGDIHAITSAHNLLAAMLDAHLFHGNDLRIDVDNIYWPRAMDMNDRALRHAVIGLGGKANGVPRETGFVITAASEIMAILALASSRQDLRRRLSEIVLGYDLDGNVVRAADIGAIGAMMVLLNEAIMPNLVQTSEHTPAFVHAGPFANIAHGTSSVISQKIALAHSDYVVNECGFGADLGAEKYLNLVMPSSGIKPSVAVIVATVRALAAHGAPADNPKDLGRESLKRGLANLGRHIENMQKFGLPVVVAINRFDSDSPQDHAIISDYCRENGVESAVNDVFNAGGKGGIELAEKVMAAAASNKSVEPIYTPEMSLEHKIETVAQEIYGADSVYFEGSVRKKLKKIKELGYGRLPICVAKTQYSFSDDSSLLGAPSGFTLTVTDARLSAGAGFVVVIAGSMLLMPGLPKVSQAMKMDVDDDGNIIGLG